MCQIIVNGAILEPSLIARLDSGIASVAEIDKLREAPGQFVFILVPNQQHENWVCGTSILAERPLFVDDLDTPDVLSNYASLCGLLSGNTEIDSANVLDYATKDAILPTASMVHGVYRMRRGEGLEVCKNKWRIAPPLGKPLLEGHASEDAAIESMKNAVRSIYLQEKMPLIGLTGGRD